MLTQDLSSLKINSMLQILEKRKIPSRKMIQIKSLIKWFTLHFDDIISKSASSPFINRFTSAVGVVGYSFFELTKMVAKHSKLESELLNYLYMTIIVLFKQSHVFN